MRFRQKFLNDKIIHRWINLLRNYINDDSIVYAIYNIDINTRKRYSSIYDFGNNVLKTIFVMEKLYNDNFMRLIPLPKLYELFMILLYLMIHIPDENDFNMIKNYLMHRIYTEKIFKIHKENIDKYFYEFANYQDFNILEFEEMFTHHNSELPKWLDLLEYGKNEMFLGSIIVSIYMHYNKFNAKSKSKIVESRFIHMKSDIIQNFCDEYLLPHKFDDEKIFNMLLVAKLKYNMEKDLIIKNNLFCKSNIELEDMYCEIVDVPKIKPIKVSSRVYLLLTRMNHCKSILKRFKFLDKYYTEKNEIYLNSKLLEDIINYFNDAAVRKTGIPINEEDKYNDYAKDELKILNSCSVLNFDRSNKNYMRKKNFENILKRYKTILI